MINVTSLEDLALYAQGQIVELPPFAEGQPLVARLRRPSLLSLAGSGKIPNALLSAATELFTGEKSKGDPIGLEEITGVVRVICEASFVEPAYAQIEEAGLNLTDEQCMAVFNYSQHGIKALDSFREEPAKHTESVGSGTEVQ